MVPVIDGWTSQWYGNVPTASNVCENVLVPGRLVMHAGGQLGLLSKAPLSSVTSCGLEPRCVQVTIVPLATVKVPSGKSLSVMSRATLPVSGAGPVDVLD